MFAVGPLNRLQLNKSRVCEKYVNRCAKRYWMGNSARRINTNGSAETAIAAA